MLPTFLKWREHAKRVGRNKEPTGIAKHMQAKGDLNPSGKELGQVNTIFIAFGFGSIFLT